jgi:C1A family cysteine protease
MKIINSILLSIVLTAAFIIPALIAGEITNKTAEELFPFDQFKKMVGVFPGEKEFSPDNPAFSLAEASALKYPASFDWRTHNIMTPVKNQGGCGSCWAFSAVGVFEALIRQRSGAVVDLAEQQLVNCVSDSDCSGGYASSAFAYMKNNGIVYENYYPYVATDGICNVSRASDFYLTRYWTQYLETSGLTARINAVKAAITNYGPSVLWMMIYNDFWHSYSSGVYIYDGTSASVGGHLIAVVGWADDSSVTNGGYWICKNSWGSSWGESGYFRIGYGQAGIDNYLYYAQFVGATNYPPDFDMTIGNISGREGTSISFSVSATDPDGDTITYSSSTLPAGAALNTSTAAFSWTPDYTQSGTYTITFYASDGKAVVGQSVTFSITNVKVINK